MNNKIRASKAQRFSEIWWKSRTKAQKSQEYMALGMGVSKKTVQNWEKGISSPSFFQFFDWFKLLDINPMPYILSYLHPDFNNISLMTENEEALENAIFQLIKNTSITEKRQLLFLMQDYQEINWYSLLQMFTAHCQTNLKSKYIVAKIICDNYNLECEAKNTTGPHIVKPDIKALENTLLKIKNTLKNNS